MCSVALGPPQTRGRITHILDTSHQCIIVPKTLLETIPKSKYRLDWEKYIQDNLPGADSSSDEMILYDWPDPLNPEPKTNPLSRPWDKPYKPRFNINIHGLLKRKPKYWFQCKIGTCTSLFLTFKAWNFHHCSCHKKIMLKCHICYRHFQVPCALRAHHNMHVVFHVSIRMISEYNFY